MHYLDVPPKSREHAHRRAKKLERPKVDEYLMVGDIPLTGLIISSSTP
jgi:preprotein translocase subunit Sss1